MSDILIVGGGAAGLMAAGAATRLGHRVTVVEHTDRPAKKILITGKGRCNVTNNCDVETFLSNVRRNPRFLYSSAAAFPPAETMALFESLNVPLKTERGRRVFPVSDRAADIADALLRYGSEAVLIREEVTALVLREGRCAGVKTEKNGILAADCVLVATGGISYPATGSCGGGYRLAKQAGHTVVQPVPSLVPLTAKGESLAECRALMGLSLKNVALTLKSPAGKPLYTEQGEMLFAHFGLSGPLVLSASSYIDGAGTEGYTAHIDWKPALTPEELDRRLAADFEKLAGKNTANSLDLLLPRRMIPVMLARWGVQPDSRVNQITRQQRLQLGALLKDFSIQLAGKEPIDRAVITAGGVSVREVSPKTMESKLCPGLFFAGEVLDVDAYTGGYNLQIAFCTAQAAARGFY